LFVFDNLLKSVGGFIESKGVSRLKYAIGNCNRFNK
jgi:hypothetical protein